MNSNKCSCSCCGSDNKKTKKKKCPLCGKLSENVPERTAIKLIKKISKPVEDVHYWLCTNPDCDVSYFTGTKAYKLNDIKTPLDFKTKTKKRYACYCGKITYEEAIKAMKETGSTSWSVIAKKVLGKLPKCNCAEKNPYGSCCSSNSFLRAVKESGVKASTDKKSLCC
ncbi:MAG: hypothetical protein KA059_07490 [Elusimicrobiales bacterium]|jgi:hypothetical protein|nr:hypothetical protein [Elusimicrobiales bacterium]